MAIAGFVPAAMLLFVFSGARNRQPPGPCTLQEVAAIADKLGLHHRSDELSGKVYYRLVVSDQPTTFDSVNRVRFGDLDHPCWRGTVAVSTPWRGFERYRHPAHGVVWGEFFLYGDPGVIRRLMSACPAGSSGP
jgi:hypothetical protein